MRDVAEDPLPSVLVVDSLRFLGAFGLRLTDLRLATGGAVTGPREGSERGVPRSKTKVSRSVFKSPLRLRSSHTLGSEAGPEGPRRDAGPGHPDGPGPERRARRLARILEEPLGRDRVQDAASGFAGPFGEPLVRRSAMESPKSKVQRAEGIRT